jgi:hypothetical protein
MNEQNNPGIREADWKNRNYFRVVLKFLQPTFPPLKVTVHIIKSFGAPQIYFKTLLRAHDRLPGKDEYSSYNMVDPGGEEKSSYLNEFEMVYSTMTLPNPSGAKIVSDFT